MYKTKSRTVFLYSFVLTPSHTSVGSVQNTSSPASLLLSSLVPSWSFCHVTHLHYPGNLLTLPPVSTTAPMLSTSHYPHSWLGPSMPHMTCPPPPRRQCPCTLLPCLLCSTDLLSVPQTRCAACPSHLWHSEVPVSGIFIPQLFSSLGLLVNPVSHQTGPPPWRLCWLPPSHSRFIWLVAFATVWKEALIYLSVSPLPFLTECKTPQGRTWSVSLVPIAPGLVLCMAHSRGSIFHEWTKTMIPLEGLRDALDHVLLKKKRKRY